MQSYDNKMTKPMKKESLPIYAVVILVFVILSVVLIIGYKLMHSSSSNKSAKDLFEKESRTVVHGDFGTASIFSPDGYNAMALSSDPYVAGLNKMQYLISFQRTAKDDKKAEDSIGEEMRVHLYYTDALNYLDPLSISVSMGNRFKDDNTLSDYVKLIQEVYTTNKDKSGKISYVADYSKILKLAKPTKFAYCHLYTAPAGKGYFVFVGETDSVGTLYSKIKDQFIHEDLILDFSGMKEDDIRQYFANRIYGEGLDRFVSDVYDLNDKLDAIDPQTEKFLVDIKVDDKATDNGTTSNTKQ